MYLYFDKLGVLKTIIPHGEIPRQGSTLNIYVCFDEDFFESLEEQQKHQVNVDLTLPNNETGTKNMITVSDPKLKLFMPVSSSEVTYDFVPGVEYLTYHFKFEPEQSTIFAGRVIANVSVVNLEEDNENTVHFGRAEIFVEKTFGDAKLVVNEASLHYKNLIKQINLLNERMVSTNGTQIISGTKTYTGSQNFYGAVNLNSIVNFKYVEDIDNENGQRGAYFYVRDEEDNDAEYNKLYFQCKDGVIALKSDLAKINDTEQTSELKFYAPTSKGENEFLLTAIGTGAPIWVDPKEIEVGAAQKAILDGVGQNIVSTYLSKTDAEKKYQPKGTYVTPNQIPTTLPASDVYEWAKQPEKPSYTKNEIGLGNVNNIGITQEQVNQIGTNKTNIENTNKQVETNIQHIASTQKTANEALNIAKGRSKSIVFNTYSDMTNYLKTASSSEFNLGDNLYIKAIDVPDYWISAVLDNNVGVYGYYEISVLETSKVDLTNYYNIEQIDAKEENLNNKIETKANASEVYTKNEIDEYKAQIGEYSNKPTAVPNSGYVENIYLNTSLSIEEVKGIIDNANLTFDTDGNYFLTNNICIAKVENDYVVQNGAVEGINAIAFLTNDFIGVGFTGWNKDLNGVISVNSDITGGTQNESLSSLLSITPFENGGTLVDKVKSNEQTIKDVQTKVENIENELGDINSILDTLNGEA